MPCPSKPDPAKADDIYSLQESVYHFIYTEK